MPGPAISAEESSYRVAAEDVLSISVVNFPNLSTQAAVPPDGMISLPLLKAVSVQGKTTDQIAQMLTSKWSEYVINPSVSVSLMSKHKESVFLTGYVVRPGSAEYRNGLHVLEALADVGGALPNGDLEQVVVTHQAGGKQTLDLSHPETKGDTEADALLEPNDVVYVPELRSEFSVIGEVNHPGSFPYKEDMTVLDALTAVGGIKETADLNAAKLTHNGDDRPIDLDALLRHGDMSLNTKLAAGDRLIIPELNNRTYVYGAVGRPGYYNYKPGDRILDALNSAGGPTQEADLTKINVIKIDKVKNTADLQQVNLDGLLKKGDMKTNLALGPGDVIFIPDKHHGGFHINDLWGVLNGLNVLQVGAQIITHGL